MKNSRLSSFVKDQRAHYLLLGVILALIPLSGVFKSATVTLLCSVLIYAVAALGLNLLLGFSGLISLGTAGFMGLATYISAYLTMNLNLPFELAAMTAIIVPVIIGLLVGLASLRIEGIYLAIATLCISEILRKTFEELVWFTNSYGGKKAEYPTLFGVWELDRTGTFLFVVVILTAVMILTYNIVKSRPGRALYAMRGSEVAAQAMGVNILRYRLFAFALATGFAALSGVLYVHFHKFTYPNTWGLNMSLYILAVVMIGGERSIYGTLLGSLIVFGLPDLVLKKLPVIGDINGIALVFNGILIVIVIMLYPQGFIKIFSDLKNLAVKLIGKGGVKKNVNA